MRCALVVAAASAAALLPWPVAAQSSGRPASSRTAERPAASWDNAGFESDVSNSPPVQRSTRPDASYSSFDTRQLSGVVPAADEAPAASDKPREPLRSAYQSPDIFRTPNPTPLERVPPPQDTYAPGAIPGENPYHPGARGKPEPPLPPFAPLVNMRISETWLPGGGDDQLGINDIDTRATFAMGRTGVFVTPGFGVHFFDGPTTTDLPGTLYDAYLDVRWKKSINDEWGFELAFTPSWYGDGDNNSSDAWRFISTALGFYQITPEWQLMAGVMYLDRFDINWFPVFGAIWADPDGESDWRYEFVFPRPKFAYRVLRCENKDQWVYLAGEFGGGAWAIQRTNGQPDMIAYRDWRAVIGYESKVKDFSAISWYTELGVAFNRQLEYDSGRGDFDPDATGMLRFGVSY